MFVKGEKCQTLKYHWLIHQDANFKAEKSKDI